MFIYTMNCYIELAIAFFILYYLYQKPPIVTEYANTILGKIILISLVFIITKLKGIVHGIVMAFIMLMIVHNTLEGLESQESDKQNIIDKVNEQLNKSIDSDKKDKQKVDVGDLSNMETFVPIKNIISGASIESFENGLFKESYRNGLNASSESN